MSWVISKLAIKNKRDFKPNGVLQKGGGKEKKRKGKEKIKEKNG